MIFFNKRTIALMGAVAIMAIVQPTAVFAISAQIPNASVVAKTKAEDLLIQGEQKYAAAVPIASIQVSAWLTVWHLLLRPSQPAPPARDGLLRRWGD